MSLGIIVYTLPLTQELVATVNENARLRGEIEQLESELQTHLQSHKHRMEETENLINSLLQKKATDEAAIAGFVTTIQELRNEKIQDSSRINSLSHELEDSGKELAVAVSRSDKLVIYLGRVNFDIHIETILALFF